MKTISFAIYYPKSAAERKRWNRQYGLNAIYAGKHWSKRNEDKEFWHAMVRSAMHRARIQQRILERPVEITMYWNDGLDIDNHAYEGKMIIDSLRGWLIQDDSRRYVKAVEHRFHDGDHILVEVREVAPC